MAVTFDPIVAGGGLHVVLDTSTTNYDLLEDIYEAGKDWFLAGQNRIYPFPFRSVSGDPVGGGQVAPPFIFLRNDLGWRIKKPEADIETRITGNLVAEDTTLALSIPPSGMFAPTLEIYLSNVANLDVASLTASLWAHVVEGTLTGEQAMRLILAASANKLSGATGAAGTINIRDLADTKDRIAATVDEFGNRTAVTVDAT